jgi:hypothetical protein
MQTTKEKIAYKTSDNLIPLKNFGLLFIDDSGANYEILPENVTLFIGAVIIYYNHFYIVTEIDYNTKQIFLEKTIRHQLF